MKKYLLGTAAIVLAVFLSAFTKADKHVSSKPPTTTYWFSVELDDIQAGNQVTDADAVFLEVNNGAEPSSACSTGDLYCTIGITDDNNVEEDQGQPGTFHIAGSVMPDITGSTRPAK